MVVLMTACTNRVCAARSWDTGRVPCRAARPGRTRRTPSRPRPRGSQCIGSVVDALRQAERQFRVAAMHSERSIGRRSPNSMPGRAMRATSPRSCSQARCSAEKYALSARSLTGRRRRGPRRDRTAGMPRMSGLRARLSCMFAPDTATASGMPWVSDNTCSLGPYREAAMRGGGRRAERRRQMPPGAAAGQRVHHCREHGPLVTRSGPTTLRTSSERRQQRGGPAPRVHQEPDASIDQHPRPAACRTNIKSRETTSKP